MTPIFHEMINAAHDLNNELIKERHRWLEENGFLKDDKMATALVMLQAQLELTRVLSGLEQSAPVGTLESYIQGIRATLSQFE